MLIILNNDNNNKLAQLYCPRMLNGVRVPDPSTGVTKINVECVRTVKADLKGEKKDSQVLIKKSGELKTPFQRQKSDPKSWWGFFF